MKPPLPSALVLAACLSACGGSDEASPSPAPGRATADAPARVFLISLDTVRAASCSLYGYGKPTTPFLEELAALDRTVVFDHHMTNSNNTLISHASILTSLYQEAHDSWDAGNQGAQRLNEGYETLAERFSGINYDTVAIASHGIWLTEEFGFRQGFDHFESEWRNNARRIHRRFGKWLDSVQPDELFAFLHFFDAHSESSVSKVGTLPYEAEPEFLAKFAPERPEDFTGTAVVDGKTVVASGYLNAFDGYYKEFPPGHLEFILGCYEAGIAQLDSDLRSLFADLEDRGLLEDSLIVITSDHGEEFKEHRRLLHNEYHSEIMHVPLMILLPDGKRPLKNRIDSMTRSVDVAPTILDLMGLEPFRDCQGVSLVPLMLEGVDPEIDYSQFGLAISRAIDEQGEYNFCNTPGYYTFYDQGSDPGQQRNLYAESGMPKELIERMSHARRRMVQVREQSRNIRDGVAVRSGSSSEVYSSDRLNTLEALGYVDLDKPKGPASPDDPQDGSQQKPQSDDDVE